MANATFKNEHVRQLLGFYDSPTQNTGVNSLNQTEYFDTMAASNLYRFSTKPTDDETGLVYDGYRYYNRINSKILLLIVFLTMAFGETQGAGNDSWFVICASPEQFHGKEVRMTGWLKIITNSKGEGYTLFMSSEDLRYLLFDRSISLEFKSMNALMEARFFTRDQYLNLDGQLVDIVGVFSAPVKGGTGELSILDIKSIGVYGGGYTTIEQKPKSDQNKKGTIKEEAKKTTPSSETQSSKSKGNRIGPSYVESPYQWQSVMPKGYNQ